MKLFKVTFVKGSNVRSMRVRAKNANLAYGYAKQHGIPSTVEPTHSRWWYMVYPALVALGLFAFYQVG